MYLFDISSLFIFLQLQQIIGICIDAFLSESLSWPHIPEAVFTELMKSSTMSVEFSFDKIIYRQRDKIAKSSPSEKNGG